MLALAISLLALAPQDKAAAPPAPEDLRPRRFASLPFDLTGVKGLEKIELSEAAKAALSKNGFVVIGGGHGSMSRCYEDTRSIPPLVTVDSVLEVFLSDFEDAWSRLEKEQAKDFIVVQEGLWNTLVERFPLIPEGVPRTAAARLLAMVAVGRRLADPTWAIPAALPEGVEPEAWRSSVTSDFDAIHRETGFFDSVLWKRRLDASRFRPVGPYAETEALAAWHRISVWWGVTGFRGEDAGEALAVGVLACLLRDTDLRWVHILTWIEETYDLLLWPPLELSPSVLSNLDVNRPELLASAEAPKVIAKWLGNRRLFLLPSRSTPEGVMFDRLTRSATPDNAVVRLLPRAVDYLAVAGNDRAREITLGLEPEGPEREWLAAQLVKARQEVAWWDDRASGSFPDRLRWMMRSLAAPPSTPELPLFARTDAWRDRGLSSALAAWVGTREIYNVRTSVSILYGALSDIVGLAEPNLDAWQRLIELWHSASRGFQRAGVTLHERSLGMALEFRRIAEKQLRGEPLTAHEKSTFQLYDITLSNMMQKSSMSDPDGQPGPPDRRVALAFARSGQPDVVRYGGKCVASLIALVEWQGRLQLVMGGVFDYREFDQPAGQAMTRKEFRTLMDSPAAPPAPEWTRSYRVEPQGSVRK